MERHRSADHDPIKNPNSGFLNDNRRNHHDQVEHHSPPVGGGPSPRIRAQDAPPTIQRLKVARIHLDRALTLLTAPGATHLDVLMHLTAASDALHSAGQDLAVRHLTTSLQERDPATAARVIDHLRPRRRARP